MALMLCLMGNMMMMMINLTTNNKKNRTHVKVIAAPKQQGMQ
jgi:hypothetical protein